MNADQDKLVVAMCAQGRSSIGVHPRSSAALPLPAPRGGPIAVRVATMADLPWMDALQKKHSKQLGYFPTKQFEGYIEMGAVLIAEEVGTEWGVTEWGLRRYPVTPSPIHPVTALRSATSSPAIAISSATNWA